MLDSGFWLTHEELMIDVLIRTGHVDAREVRRPFLWPQQYPGKAIEIVVCVIL